MKSKACTEDHSAPTGPWVIAAFAPRRAIAGWRALVAVIVLSLGCGGRPEGKPPPELLSPANLDRIHNGMTMSQVQLILGQWTIPPSSGGSPQRYVWRRGDKEIDVDFLNDKVVAKSAKGLESSANQSPP